MLALVNSLDGLGLQRSNLHRRAESGGCGVHETAQHPAGISDFVSFQWVRATAWIAFR